MPDLRWCEWESRGGDARSEASGNTKNTKEGEATKDTKKKAGAFFTCFLVLLVALPSLVFLVMKSSGSLRRRACQIVSDFATCRESRA